MIPAPVPIRVWRNARYTEEFRFKIGDEPYNLTGWTGMMQVRQYGAQPGTALISLPSVTTNVQGVRVIEPLMGAVQVRIDEATLTALWTALGGPAEAGDTIKLKYDLVMSSSAAGDEVWIEGDFIIEPGVTV